MHSPPSNKSQKSKAAQSKPAQAKPAPAPKIKLLTPALLLAAVLGLGLVSILPSWQTVPSKQAPSPAAAAAIMNNDQKDGNLHVQWLSPTSQAQFWLDNTPTPAQCDRHNCTVPKGSKVGWIYFRWFNNADNKWYYFQCGRDYKGQFQGIPLSS